ncbi:EAL domain-containing protein [Sulfurimonas sp. SAG-AH-194-L11]|nr:EAL domain-containing protein [Sulfurimonas sp. SAG-AH-194-L11]MDF1877494.1 EAL domain-containing protein [Sulfurimonas sp. SAG-AH-194-L11]
MQKNILKFIILPSILIIILSVIYYNQVQYETNVLIQDKYALVIAQDKKQLATLIEEKQENILTISLAVSKYPSIQDVLLGKNSDQLKLKEFSTLLKDTTSMKNLWFQIIAPDGTSLYRSFSNKYGDNLTKARIEIADIIDYPRVISTISVGKFSITYKSIVPVYYKSKFIGLFETIAHFNSISKKINQKGLASLLLIDKKYKKQLVYSLHKQFLDDYYIADKNPNPTLISYLQDLTPQKVLQHSSRKYILDKGNNLLISSYTINDYLDNDLGYFILFKDLDDIDINDIQQIENNVLLLFGVTLLLLYILMYYIYRKLKHTEIEKKNQELEKNIKMKNDVLEYVSLHDSLTSLPNRKLFKKKLTSLLANKTIDTEIYVMYIGIDKLKEINDAYGHNIGDKIIQSTALTLINTLQEDALVARLTADEFAVALLIKKSSCIEVITAKLLKDIQLLQEIRGKQLAITVSIGLSSVLDEAKTSSLLLRNANTAMYKAKSLNGNTYQFYTPEMTTNLLDKIKLANDLNHAIINDEFEPYFQPQIDALSNTIVGMEGLVRWIHPKLGIIYPDRFIPYAEESGLIVEIDRIMMRKSMQAVMSLKNASTLRLSLNLSAVNLESANFMKELKNTLILTNFNAKNLELEMLESQIMKDQESSIALLHELKELGISISIDDFGTGYSSLSALKKLPITKLKIDKSFVDNLPYDKDDIAIVETIIALANALKLKLIAEGVETKEQKDFLVAHKCCTIQGYYYSKPLSQKDFKEFMIKFPN